MAAAGSGTLASFVANSRVRVKLLEDLSKGPMTPTELASIECKHVSHVSRALAELKAQGLIEAVSADSREKKYRVTFEGLTICSTVSKMVK